MSVEEEEEEEEDDDDDDDDDEDDELAKEEVDELTRLGLGAAALVLAEPEREVPVDLVLFFLGCVVIFVMIVN